jgi:chaperone modulatory protein CbpM
MKNESTTSTVYRCEWVEEDVGMTLAQLSEVTGCSEATIVALVEQGVLEPRGMEPAGWLFVGSSLRRTRVALRLISELEVNPAGAAVALDLLEQIDRLQVELPASSRH